MSHLFDESGVGKTCIMKRILENKYEEIDPLTLGFEFGNRIIDINNHVIKLQIWDSVNLQKEKIVCKHNCLNILKRGSESLRSMIPGYYRQ